MTKLSIGGRSRSVTTAGSFLNALAYEDKHPKGARGLDCGILVHDRDTGMPMHVLPKKNALLSGNIKCYFPNNTYDEGKTEREIGNSFKGAYEYAKNRLENKKTKASHHNPHGIQFPTYRKGK